MGKTIIAVLLLPYQGCDYLNLCCMIMITKTMVNKYLNCATCLGLLVTNGLMHACAGKTFQMISFNTCLSQQHTKKSVAIVDPQIRGGNLMSRLSLRCSAVRKVLKSHELAQFRFLFLD